MIRILLSILIVSVATVAEARSYNRRGRNNGNNRQITQLQDRWDKPPIWYGPMMSQYLQNQYGIGTIGYAGLDGSGGFIYRPGSSGYSGAVEYSGYTAPTMYINPFVKSK